MFQQLEAHLHSEVNTLGYPAAALFAFCVALVAYNVLAVVKGALRRLHGEATIHDTVSGYYIAGEIGRTSEALLGMVSADQWTQVQALSQAAFLALLMQLAHAVDLAKYREHPRGPKKPKPQRTKRADQPPSQRPSSWGVSDDGARLLRGHRALPARLVLNLRSHCL